MSNPFADALVLTGPTAAGKSALALELAARRGAEIIAMDSMTLYRGLDIGTAKPSAAEQQRVRHHLLDVLEPWESASVAWWLERATRAAEDMRARGKSVLLVGGTPLYLKALLFGLFEGPAADAALRAQLEAEAAVQGSAVLHTRLQQVDPVAAARLHPNDLRRIIRALEVQQLTGTPLSEWQQQWDKAPALPGLRCYWLDRPRPELYQRIDARVEQMFAEGLVEEVQALRALPRPLSKEARQALGYQEVFAYLDGAATLAATRALIQQRSRNFAKRQVTWFRHLPQCVPLSDGRELLH